MATAHLLEVRNAAKAFDEKVILRDVSVHVDEGETLTVLGKSGTGKSVLLKIIVGLLQPEKGEVFYRGQNLLELEELELNEVRKKIGFLFQGAALFDSMSVGENLEMYLKKHSKFEQSEREKKIKRALELVELSDVIDQMPSELSGGMRKRAGLARSIVLEPEMILYDEPTTGLDPVTASSIAELILTLQKELKIASIVVTHDLPTAYTVSDRAVVLSDGLKIFDGNIEELGEQKDEFLQDYLKSSKVDRSHRDAILQSVKRGDTMHSGAETKSIL
jgi:phospholipid/cholesterol/gamma-HCH transport system ATP-binding protein